MNFKKGWNKALLATGVDIDSSLFDEHDPGPRPVVDEAPAPIIDSGVSASQSVPAGASFVQGTIVAPFEGVFLLLQIRESSQRPLNKLRLLASLF